LFALAVWAVQRLLSKVALATLGTRKFYLLSAAVSLAALLSSKTADKCCSSRATALWLQNSDRVRPTAHT